MTTTYFAPVRDMRFVIEELAEFGTVVELPAFAEHDVGSDLLEAVLKEASKLATEVLGPLNKEGDVQGARLDAGGVATADGFVDAYRQFVDGGWNGLGCSAEHGGQGLPELLNIATQEIWQASNLSFSLCPLLTLGAVETITCHGSAAQQDLYLPRMVSGEWTGTMNLTEPQAGSDLSAVRTRAVPEGDHYRLYGQKIYITWGEHDMAANTIHLVLARTPDAPEGVKGISLFIVPKYLIDHNGSLGARNDVHCVSLEHKLGIHASPTCVMAYGEKEGAIGYLVGEENKGLAYMFTMMNEARLKVGLQGLAIADRAYQQAREFAKDRIQGRPAGIKHGDRVNILHHPDVRRMLLTMKSQVEAMRALCYVVAKDMDIARHHPDAEVRRAHQTRIDLLIPVVKGWCTEIGIEVTSLGIQIHGGMGYIEETGACQHLRDARITTIYEGTTGIQASDLVSRKLSVDRGAAMAALIDEMRATQTALGMAQGDDLIVIRQALSAGIDVLERATAACLRNLAADPNLALAGSVNYTMLVGYVCGGWQMARAALAAQRRREAGVDPVFHETKVVTARFYAEQILPKAAALLTSIESGGATVMALAEEQF